MTIVSTFIYLILKANTGFLAQRSDFLLFTAITAGTSITAGSTFPPGGLYGEERQTLQMRKGLVCLFVCSLPRERIMNLGAYE